MAWNTLNNRYEVDTEEQVLQRLLDEWNKINNISLTLNEITGSGLEAVMYTYIRGYNTLLQAGISDIASFMTYNIMDSQQKISRPNVIADNIPSFGDSLDIEVVAFDTNDRKLEGNPDGAYFVFKGDIGDTDIDTVFKSSVVVGTKTYGSSSKDINLSNSQVVSFNYTVATELKDFRLKIRIKLRYKTAIESATASIQKAVADWYQENYKLGMDIVSNDVTSIIQNSDFPYIDEVAVEHKVAEGDTWTQGSYIIPYENFVSLSASKIEVEVIDGTI